MFQLTLDLPSLAIPLRVMMAYCVSLTYKSVDVLLYGSLTIFSSKSLINCFATFGQTLSLCDLLITSLNVSLPLRLTTLFKNVQVCLLLLAMENSFSKSSMHLIMITFFYCQQKSLYHHQCSSHSHQARPIQYSSSSHPHTPLY